MDEVEALKPISMWQWAIGICLPLLLAGGGGYITMSNKLATVEAVAQTTRDDTRRELDQIHDTLKDILIEVRRLK